MDSMAEWTGYMAVIYLMWLALAFEVIRQAYEIQKLKHKEEREG